MRKMRFLTLIFFIFLIVPITVFGQSYDRLLIEGGGSSQDSSTKLSEDAESSRKNSTKNILERVYDLFSNAIGNRRIISVTPTPPQPQEQPSTPNEGNPNNLLPTGVYTSITYFPQVDPNNILNNTGLNYSDITASLQTCLQNRKVYETAAAITGVPWQVLAGIHFTEGSCRSNVSLRSGTPFGQVELDIGSNCSSQDQGVGEPKVLGYDKDGKTLCGFDNLLDTAVDTGNHLKGKNRIGQDDGVPRTHQELVYALSYYNGGGNQNCLRTRQTIAPYADIPGNCPPLFEGEDDSYVFNKTPDGKHDVMYIRFCDRGKACGEIGKTTPPHRQYGVITVAGALGSI